MDKLDKEIFEKASKYLDREKAKKICEESTRRGLELSDNDESFCKKHGEAIIFLEGIGELEKVQEEIYSSEWYNSYFDEKGNLIK